MSLVLNFAFWRKLDLSTSDIFPRFDWEQMWPITAHIERPKGICSAKKNTAILNKYFEYLIYSKIYSKYLKDTSNKGWVYAKLKIDTLNINYKYIEYLKYSKYIRGASYKGWVYAKLNGATVPSRPLLNLPYQTQRWLRSGNVGSLNPDSMIFLKSMVFPSLLQ